MSFYNVRLIEYNNSSQVRLYKKPIISQKDKKGKNENEEEINEEKTEQSKLDREKKDNDKADRSKISSANRTKQKVYEICRANNWEWFITLTFNRKKIDSSNYDLLSEKVSQWIKNIKKTHANDLRYIIIPELHEDGEHYHFHALVSETGDLSFVDSGIKYDNEIIYNVDNFKYGFSTATKIIDTKRASSYIAKYITKDLVGKTKGKKKYWSSRNLDAPIIRDFIMTAEEKDELLNSLTSEITHMKTQTLPHLGQQIDYLELRK